MGSSPPVRGALHALHNRVIIDGLIPACAGSTTWPVSSAEPIRAHPRPCGEHTTGLLPICHPWGSSPPVRGALWAHPKPLEYSGLIPACAGSTDAFQRGHRARRAHPRLCGEHKSPLTLDVFLWGSSPPVRGAPATVDANQRDDGLIPACAGSTGRRGLDYRRPGAHPRLCGEHHCTTISIPRRMGSSPPVRGAPPVSTLVTRTSGLIPACAGST